MAIDRSRLDGRVAVVTGAGRGIGYEIAGALAGAGASVVIAELDPALGEAAASKLGGAASFTRIDVADSASVDAAAAAIHEQRGRIDILVNNAGICINASAVETTDAIWRRQLGVNLDGVFFCCRAFGRFMVEARRGAIVNISSIAGVIDVWPQRHIAYSVSKAGVTQISRVLASEWAQHNVRVNAIAPGYVATDMPFASGTNAGLIEGWTSRIPLGRMTEPAEIASAVAFLASDAASAVTGHLLMADGGYTVW
jgi:NAD(P)-dependent dehydrogenase (short-subunit alcohol dehydrogenase family)